MLIHPNSGGEIVMVRTKTKTGTDSHNNAAYTYTDAAVYNVLIAPGPRSDLAETNRPDASHVKYTLYFPSAFSGNLEGCEVKLRGKWYKVIGAPDRYSPALKLATRTHNLIAEVEAFHG